MAVISSVATPHGETVARGLLNGTDPLDPTAGAAVDAALRRRSTDPVLHAAALLLASRAGTDLGLSRSHAKRWALGMDVLIDRGHLDAAAYAAPRLNATFPGMPYLEHMALVFRRLPEPVIDGRPLFVDDEQLDVQVVPRSGARTVIIAFCGIGHRLGLSLSLIDRWFAQLGGHMVYLRDHKRVAFTGGVTTLGDDMAATVESLTAVVGDLGGQRIVCTGNSAGASAALRYAKALGAERVLAFAPITGGPAFIEKVAANLPLGGVMPWGDLVPLYRDATGVRARILYGELNQGDREESLRMAGLPGVTVEALVGWDSHHLIGGLLRAGRLEQVLGWLTHDEGIGV